MNSAMSSSTDDSNGCYCRTISKMSSTVSDPVTSSSDSCSDGAVSPVTFTAQPPPRPVTPPLGSPSRLGMKMYMRGSIDHHHKDDGDELEPIDLELEMMKERLSKLLLGEDMSGGGKGVCTAMTISNAITNLYATIFGNTLKLEPLQPEKKMMWKREMDCLLSVCDFIVEFNSEIPQDADLNEIEEMATRQRTDVQMNLPALRKLDGMLIDILDSFQETEFWYVEQKNMPTLSRTTSIRKVPSRADDKWWLPVPCIPTNGLSDRSKKHLRHQKDCANQIHKAAMAINNNILNEMDVPESFITGLPKSGKSCLGDVIYKHMYNMEVFHPDILLDTLRITSEHEALELADRVEACMYTWRRKAGMVSSKSSPNMKSSSNSLNRLEGDRNDKNHVLAERAETLLFCLKHRYPELSQTTLDTCKIQYNKDVGQAILESYSRVLEGLAYNIVAWVDDVLNADDLKRAQGNV